MMRLVPVIIIDFEFLNGPRETLQNFIYSSPIISKVRVTTLYIYVAKSEQNIHSILHDLQKFYGHILEVNIY